MENKKQKALDKAYGGANPLSVGLSKSNKNARKRASVYHKNNSSFAPISKEENQELIERIKKFTNK